MDMFCTGFLFAAGATAFGLLASIVVALVAAILEALDYL